jgi:NADPH-dependent 7-cyano-7-deazaguanine reductase QueF-like protein
MNPVLPISRHEKLAVLFVFLSLSAGLFLALCFTPIWLNRAGSVVIVIGVLLATSRLADIAEANVAKLFSDNFEKEIINTIKKIEETHSHTLDSSTREALRKGVHIAMANGFKNHFECWRHRVKRYEVAFVVAGTLVNGFGDWVFCLALGCSPG